MNLQLSLLTRNYCLKLSTQFSKLFALYDLLNNILLSGFGEKTLFNIRANMLHPKGSLK